MTDELTLRLADPDRDADAVASIYRPAVESSAATFEEVAPDADEMADRMRRILTGTPWLVAESQTRLVGYAYAAPHRERAGYRWSVDVSAYVHPDWQGRRVGRALYDRLLALLLGPGLRQRLRRDRVAESGERGAPRVDRHAAHRRLRAGRVQVRRLARRGLVRHADRRP